MNTEAKKQLLLRCLRNLLPTEDLVRQVAQEALMAAECQMTLRLIDPRGCLVIDARRRLAWVRHMNARYPVRFHCRRHRA